MFIAGRTNQKVFEYSLSVNFDISEADYTGNSFDVSSQVKSVFLGLAFSDDGTKCFYYFMVRAGQPIVFINFH